MRRLLLLAEGKTELAFVRNLLTPHLLRFDIAASSTCIETRRDRAKGRTYRGGHGGRYAPIQKHVRNLLQSKPDAVTTLLDYYAIPDDFPGYSSLPQGTCFERAAHLEQAFSADIGDPRFIPNLIVHEFEALLFTSPELIADEFIEAPGLIELRGIACAFASPEEINDSPETAPSKRLEKIYPTFSKVRHGSLIAQKIGLEAIRSKCEHFHRWLCRIEQL
jgi:hypothetical protein